MSLPLTFNTARWVKSIIHLGIERSRLLATCSEDSACKERMQSGSSERQFPFRLIQTSCRSLPIDGGSSPNRFPRKLRRRSWRSSPRLSGKAASWQLATQSCCSCCRRQHESGSIFKGFSLTSNSLRAVKSPSSVGSTVSWLRARHSSLSPCKRHSSDGGRHKRLSFSSSVCASRSRLILGGRIVHGRWLKFTTASWRVAAALVVEVVCDKWWNVKDQPSYWKTEEFYCKRYINWH